jgi:phosphoribosyl-ATP pyrophosphohydrolase
MEEAFEVCLELGRGDVDRARVAEEAADLVFHLMVGLTGAGVDLSDVEDVLEARRR